MTSGCDGSDSTICGCDLTSEPHARSGFCPDSVEPVERMDDPFRKSWYEFCRSLTREQTDLLLEHDARKSRQVAHFARSSADAEAWRDGYASAVEQVRIAHAATGLDHLKGMIKVMEHVRDDVQQRWERDR